MWPGDAGFEFLRARVAPAPEGSKFNAQKLEPFQFTATEPPDPAECADLLFLLQRRKGEEPMTCSQHAHSTTKGGLADLIEAPLGGVPPPIVFGVRRSLEEQSFEIGVFLEASVRILFSALSSAGSWILGFGLGKFLDFLGKVG